MYTKNMTREDINSCIKEAFELSHSLSTVVKNIMVKNFNDCFENDEILIDDIFLPINNTFNLFNTEYKRFQYFEKNEFYIKPNEFTIGQYEASKIVNGKFGIYPIEATGQYISVRKTAETFFSIPGNFEKVFDFMKEMIEDTSDNIQHFLQADLYKKYAESFPEIITIPLKLNYNKFESDNPIGPHAGSDKMGAVYFTFLCLPPEFASKLKNIFLNVLFNHNDRVEFGVSNAVKPLLNELKEMESNPIKIKTHNDKTVFLRLLLITGDNLGLSEFLGFVENFSKSHYPCRICKMHRDILINSCEEDESLLRNLQNYMDDLRLYNVSLSGINSECAFNRLASYHCCLNSICDIMHDLYEGIIRYILCFLILLFIKLKYFKLAEFNGILGGSDYGLTDNNNRPNFLKPEKLESNTLGMSASEANTFTKHFGLLIGHKIPINEPNWELYKTLIEFLSLIESRIITENIIQKTKVTAQRLCSLFHSLTGKNIMFKLHMILHYFRLMRMIGPLKSLCCMRDEAKHKANKVAAHLTTSRKNLAKTLAISHQIKLCAKFFHGEGLENLIDTGPQDNSIITNNIKIQFQDVLVNMHCVKHVKTKGLKYKPNMVLTLDGTNDLPKFGQIKSIFVDSLEECKKLIFIVKNLHTESYDDHYQAYKLKKDFEVSYTAIDHDKLLNIFPTDILYNGFGHPYVIMKK